MADNTVTTAIQAARTSLKPLIDALDVAAGIETDLAALKKQKALSQKELTELGKQVAAVGVELGNLRTQRSALEGEVANLRREIAGARETLTQVLAQKNKAEQIELEIRERLGALNAR